MPRSSEATSRRWNLPVQRNALADLVAPTVDEEECAFLGAQNTRATTIEMAEKPVAEDDGIPWRDRPRALRAPRGLLFRHWSIPNAKGAGWLTPGARRQLASPRVLQWSASGSVAPESSLFDTFPRAKTPLHLRGGARWTYPVGRVRVTGAVTRAGQ